MEPRLRRYG
jgi:feruloyl-CoA synthase